MNLTAGTVLHGGKYVLNQPLSQGGLSFSFKAVQTALNKPVVLKTIVPNPRIPIDFVQRKQQLLEQIRYLTQCQHPALVGVLDLFEEAGLPFVVMDYVAGQSLAERVQSKGPLPEEKALQYIRQVGSALSQVHRTGLIHRDVKPENLIRPAGADLVVLVDFGIAHPVTVGMPELAVMLSPNSYVAIEQYRAQERLTPATDIYSLAASLYFLVTGQKPIPAAQRHRSPLIAPRKFRPQLSPEVEAAILKGMEIDPQLRPPTIAAWFALLPSNRTLPPVHEFANRATLPLSPTAQGTPASSNGAGAQTPPPVTSVPRSVPTSRPTSRPIVSSNRVSVRSLMAASLVTAVLGGGIGLALRLSGATGPGSTFFHTEQGFPPLADWAGTPAPVASPAASSAPAAAPPSSVTSPSESVADPPPVPRRRRMAPVSPPPVESAPVESSPAPVAPVETPKASESSAAPSPAVEPAPPTVAAPSPAAPPVSAPPAVAPAPVAPPAAKSEPLPPRTSVKEVPATKPPL